MDQVRELVRYLHYSLSTEKADLPWVRFSLAALVERGMRLRAHQPAVQPSTHQLAHHAFGQPVHAQNLVIVQRLPGGNGHPALVVAHFCLGVERVQLA